MYILFRCSIHLVSFSYVIQLFLFFRLIIVRVSKRLNFHVCNISTNLFPDKDGQIYNGVKKYTQVLANKRFCRFGLQFILCINGKYVLANRFADFADLACKLQTTYLLYLWEIETKIYKTIYLCNCVLMNSKNLDY